MTNMTNPSAFIDAYMQNLKTAGDQKVAYEMTELQYMQQHNLPDPKYKCWDTFRRMKNRMIKKNRK